MQRYYLRQDKYSILGIGPIGEVNRFSRGSIEMGYWTITDGDFMTFIFSVAAHGNFELKDVLNNSFRGNYEISSKISMNKKKFSNLFKSEMGFLNDVTTGNDDRDDGIYMRTGYEGICFLMKNGKALQMKIDDELKTIDYMWRKWERFPYHSEVFVDEIDDCGIDPYPYVPSNNRNYEIRKSVFDGRVHFYNLIPSEVQWLNRHLSLDSGVKNIVL